MVQSYEKQGIIASRIILGTSLMYLSKANLMGDDYAQYFDLILQRFIFATDQVRIPLFITSIIIIITIITKVKMITFIFF